MAVPNTNTFTMQDVTQAVGLGSGGGNTLTDCFDDADPSQFDIAYNPNSDGQDNNLYNFRNYGNQPVMTLFYVPFGGSSTVACSGKTTPIYQVNFTFDFTKPIYSNSAGTINAPSAWYKSNVPVASTRYWTGSSWSGSAVLC